MYTLVDKEMMLKFLAANYPVARVKHKHKFRRGIILESGTYLLSDYNNQTQLIKELSSVLQTVFNCDYLIAYAVLDNFLNII
jgi:hypothetical protein